MNLLDKEILELNELCNAVVEGTLTEPQKARLSHWLVTSVPARQFYIRAMGVSASLISYASEMQSERAEVREVRTTPARNGPPWWWWFFGSLAAATAVVLMVWVNQPKQNLVVAQPPTIVSVAQLTGAKGCEWMDNASAVLPGSHLQKGQRIELARGFAEITFDSGALVVLQGPASLDLKSAWAATLNHGTLKASVPPEAIGFSISNPNVEVMDLGTEFIMSANAGGAAEVLVLKGKVEAESSAAPNRQPILLTAKESRRFESSGVSAVNDAGQKFAELTQPIVLDHFKLPTDCMHWSFDETSGTYSRAESSGQPVSASDMRLVPKGAADVAHTPGRWQGALRFDGSLYAKAALPGLSDYSAHTVVFWVKVPKDAMLSSAYAMVAWGVNNDKLGSHPIHISWNRNPAEGTIGVLRTDFGGGFALGSTPLRDGEWHHIAVVFIPTDDANKTVEVKQYVDGRFQGEGQASPPGSDVFKKLSAEKPLAVNDVVWLGCQLGINGPRAERFRGEMDELFIANRALEPLEIVQLMNYNKLQLEVASSKESE